MNLAKATVVVEFVCSAAASFRRPGRGHWREFGTGQLGNCGSHATFLAFTGMKRKAL